MEGILQNKPEKKQFFIRLIIFCPNCSPSAKKVIYLFQLLLIFGWENFTMTLEECYAKMGANYQDVLKRLYKPEMIKRFVKMFLQDDNFQLLTDAMAAQDVKEAFRAAHTLKGVCLNLGFDNLSPSAVALTEILRAGTFDGAAEQYALVKEEYQKTIEAIQNLD